MVNAVARPFASALAAGIRQASGRAMTFTITHYLGDLCEWRGEHHYSLIRNFWGLGNKYPPFFQPHFGRHIALGEATLLRAVRAFFKGGWYNSRFGLGL